ncbi:hypothetical protein M9H77_32132 [Catharanthus roseus]|uniref:Uncharacterized protein n=1 Tax=Catharanthus roseus TaxID=4058 RepID=A0ACC0A3A6_CATRO|nr:hypothetical protein M9H77_32132 [Catharanthus roseus]
MELRCFQEPAVAAQRNHLQGPGGQGPGKSTPAKYQELKVNMERHHMETGLPILTDEQLMFEVACGDNKGHVYGFSSQSIVITTK